MGGEQREGTEDNDLCFARKHMEQHHQGEESRFRTKVTRTNNDSMTRQVREGVMIRRASTLEFQISGPARL